MNFPFFISKRYFNIFSGNNFIHLIGLISLVSIAFSTMALIVALSIFNGLENLMVSLFNSFNPDLKISLIEGKTFKSNNIQKEKISKLKEVSKVVNILEDNALLKYKDKHMIVKVKGVSNNFLKNNELAKKIVKGNFKLYSNYKPRAIIGRGVRHFLKIRLYDNFYPIKILYPRKITSNILDNSKIFTSQSIKISSVFSLQKEVDYKYIIIPIKFMRKLTKQKNKLTSLDVYINNKNQIDTAKRQIKKILPKEFKVQDINEQTEGFISAMKVEKKILRIIFLCIVVVASLNLFFVLSMLVVKKSKDIGTLYTLGVKNKTIKSIFIYEGLYISLLGALSGTILALIFCFCQKKFKIISLGVESTIIDHYPIDVKVKDVFYAFTSVSIAGFMSSIKPAIIATKFNKNFKN